MNVKENIFLKYKMDKDDIYSTQSINKYWSIEWDNNDVKTPILFNQLEKSNLPQSIEYADSKKITENWCINRGFIKYKDEIKAIFIVLEKRWGPITINRINRGPLFADNSINLDEKLSIFKCIRKKWKWYHGKFLFLSPFLTHNSTNMGILKSAGFKRCSKAKYSSIWIDWTTGLSFWRYKPYQ